MIKLPQVLIQELVKRNLVAEEKIEELVRKHFPLKPGHIIKELDLKKPIYSKTAAYGHFGRNGFSWERTDKADILRRDGDELGF